MSATKGTTLEQLTLRIAGGSYPGIQAIHPGPFHPLYRHYVTTWIRASIVADLVHQGRSKEARELAQTPEVRVMVPQDDGGESPVSVLLVLVPEELGAEVEA